MKLKSPTLPVSEFFSDDGYKSVVVNKEPKGYTLDCYISSEYAYSVTYKDKTIQEVEDIAENIVFGIDKYGT